MSQRPAAAGVCVGAPLEAIGRAQRARCWPEGEDAEQSTLELWRLPGSADALATRLLALHGRGIGAFFAGGVDEEGPWLLRRSPRSMASWIREQEGPIAWQRAVAMLASLADILAACESDCLFPGPLDAEGIDLGEDDCCQLRGDSLVHALVGAGESQSSIRSRWMAPEQAEGGEANAASNRYVLGLLLYRLLAGEHAFAGRGLRQGLSDRANRGAPPFPSRVGAALPAGLQSYCLRLLDPEIEARPSSSAAIARRLRSFASESAIAAPRTQLTRPSIPVPRAHHQAQSSAVPRRLPMRSLVAALVLVAGVATATFAIASIDESSERGTLSARDRAPLGDARSVESCQSCHPRQAAEWKRSVMAHSAKSPLFQSLEMLIQEQVGKSRDCPEGAGILRSMDPSSACRNPATGQPITGSGGQLWCVNCHAPNENLRASMPAWDGLSFRSSSRQPLRDLLPEASMEGIGCGFCHQVHAPVRPGNEQVGLYEGNPSWASVLTGERFSMRPEDRRGLFGIANSGYSLDPAGFLRQADDPLSVPGGAHSRPDAKTRAYLRSSEFCGSCHDVRLFGSDVLGAKVGEHFKRLRNAYSEWAQWKLQEEREGRVAATCQDCHMSTYPGVCVPGEKGEGDSLCPSGSVFSARAPGEYASASTSAASLAERVSNHYFSGVDVPLSDEFPLDSIDDNTLDTAGIPLGARQRRDLLLASTFRLEILESKRRGDTLEIPIEFENIGAGHRVPAGFSQEREVWIHLQVRDANGQLVYEVGRVGRGDEDLRDKIFLDINTSDQNLDRAGRPVGLFGADILDGPDHPEWISESANRFRGKGLVNLQNGFLRCVRCIGRIDEFGRCQAGPGQEGHRAARFADGDYDADTGECRSNLRGEEALFEVFFPIGALDASRGLVRGPDAIVDTRSAAPNTPQRYTYEVPAGQSVGPYTIEARMMFRAFPPFLLRAFADYERAQDRQGRRPSGPLLGSEVLQRLELSEIARAESRIP